MINKVYVVRVGGNEDWMDVCASFKDVMESIEELLEEEAVYLDSETKDTLLHTMIEREALGYEYLLTSDMFQEEVYTEIYVQAAPLRGV